MGRIKDARPHLERSLAVRDAALGSDHPDVATSLVNLGRLAMAEGELEKARVHLERCVKIREAKLGPAHPHLVTALEVYTEILRELGDHAGAATVEERVRAIRTRAEN